MTNLQLTIGTVVSVLLALFWAWRTRKKERLFWVAMAATNGALLICRAVIGMAT